MRSTLAATALILMVAWTAAEATDPRSDAPEPPVIAHGPVKEAASYAEALRIWRTSEDVNAWIGAKFEYDMSRAMLLSETQRTNGGRLPIHRPDAFFATPSGVCVDLSRFAVETLRAIDPQARPAYLMIEFAPISIGGNTLRRHWLVSFEHDGKHYFFADSKRPGVIAGPYASTRDFIEEYARYRNREVVGFRQMESYERKTRTLATKQQREPRP